VVVQVYNTFRIHKGDRFSLTFDEWISIKNRRYMNINIHTNKQFWNFSLIRIHGSMPAQKCIITLENKLAQFKISLDGVVAITTDGAAVVTKVGKSINVRHQLCLAHAIQLAVIKVIYNNKKKNPQEILKRNHI